MYHLLLLNPCIVLKETIINLQNDLEVIHGKLAKQLESDKFVPQKFWGLVKVNKPDALLRLIVSKVGASKYQLSKFIANILS